MMTIICNSLFCKFSFSDVSATLQSRKSSSSNESDAVHQRLSEDRTVDTKQIQGNSYITNTGSEGESKNGFTLKDSLTVHKNLLTIFSRQYFVLYSEEKSCTYDVQYKNQPKHRTVWNITARCHHKRCNRAEKVAVKCFLNEEHDQCKT